MSLVFQKGFSFQANYASPDYPVLSSDWSSGSTSIYSAYPGTAVLVKQLVRDGNVFRLNISANEILALDDGLYTVVTSVTNAATSETFSAIEYATVAAVKVFTVPMTKLYITMAKSDATPAGKQTRTLTNTVDGTTVTLGWKGLAMTVTNSVADKNGTSLIDTETVSVETNAAGYAEVYVVKGLSYTVTCPGFGKPITVDTTGLDEINLNTYF